MHKIVERILQIRFTSPVNLIKKIEHGKDFTLTTFCRESVYASVVEGSDAYPIEVG